MIVRAHVWVNGRCRRCAMRSTWVGARHGCEGIAKYENAETKARKVKQNRAWRERVREERRARAASTAGLVINPMETSR